ncbi:MAG: tetraacyldisaccharide 4'-kinase [Myxococcota bacterium]
MGSSFFLLWRLLGLFLLPVLLLDSRSRRHILRLPAPEPGWTWLHGASAGEHRAAKGLQTALPPTVWRTRSSMRTPITGTFPAPLDLPFVVSRWLDRARPGRLILVEGELWPGWLVACRHRGIPVTVVNARPSEGARRWQRLGPVWRWMVADVTFIPQAETGDLKQAAPKPRPALSLPRSAIVGASTRPGDEARLLNAWQSLSSPRPQLILAPRHLHRVSEIGALLDQAMVRWCKRSDGIDATAEVVVLDTMGELAGLLHDPHIRVAFIGGTFSENIGGHSPAEALSAGLPVVRGPHAASNPIAWARSPDRIFVAQDTLLDALIVAMGCPRQPQPNSDAAQRVVERLPATMMPAGRTARPLLLPLTGLWQRGASRLPSYAARPQKVDVPVISVGALVAGGAGKTPAVGWLAQRLAGAWVVARGYRRPKAGPPVRIQEGLGDELEMLRRRGIPVVSAPDRVAGARAAVARGARLILLDDGFQHRRLARDLDIVCIDGRWPGGRGMIPAGSRREPWSALHRAHWIWHSHADYDLPSGLPLPLVRARLQPAGWIRRGARLPLEALPPGPRPAMTGIARPEGFACMLLKMGIEISHWRTVGDHQPLFGLPAGCIVTEKDAARLPVDADVWALAVSLEVTGGAPLLDAIEALR